MPGELFYIGGNTENAKSTDHVRLLLLLSEQHLSTVLYDPIQKQVFQWGMLELPTDLFQTDEVVKAYFETHQLIAENTTKTSLISFTERQSIIPLSLCDTNNISLFAHLLFPSGKQDLVLTDKDQGSNTAVIYSPDQSVCEALKRIYPAVSVTHLFHHMLKQSATEQPVLTLNILPSRCVITVQYEKKWQLLQSYQYQTGEDILYLLLKAIEQLGKQPADTIVRINGLVDRNSSLAKLIEQYIPVLEWGAELHYTYPESEGFDSHTFSLIDSILTCVS